HIAIFWARPILGFVRRCDCPPVIVERLGELTQMLPAFAQFNEYRGTFGTQSIGFFQSLNGAAEIARELELACQLDAHGPILRQSLAAEVQDFDLQAPGFRCEAGDERLSLRMGVMG